MSLSDNPFEVLAPPWNTTRVFVVVLVSLKHLMMWQKMEGVSSILGFQRFHVT
jgi:hypothetical protein